MDSGSFEYTKFPAQRAKARRARSRPVSALVAAAVLAGAFFAAGTLIFPKSVPAAPVPAAAIVPVPQAAPVASAESRVESPPPIVYDLGEKPEPAAAAAVPAAAVPAPVLDSCPSCAGAVDAVRIDPRNVPRLGATPGATAFPFLISYVGPCETGHIYRLTNNQGRGFGSGTLISDLGDVWDLKASAPGESVELRSRGLIQSLQLRMK